MVSLGLERRTIGRERGYLEHRRLILTQHSYVLVVSIGPVLRVGEFRERSNIGSSLTTSPAEKLHQRGFNIRTLGFK